MKPSAHCFQCGWRRAWIMFDMDNGHSKNNLDNGKGYMWVFASYTEAMKHRRKQHKMKYAAKLSMPFMIEAAR